MPHPNINIQDFRRSHGLAAAGIVDLNAPYFNRLSPALKSLYATGNLAGQPDYMIKTADLRSDPRRLFPQAKTAFAFAMSFDKLPQHRLPKPGDGKPQGIIAGYAVRKDYHAEARRLASEFAYELSPHSCELCVDTKPLAERFMALAAGIGKAGLNQNILFTNAAFLFFIFSDIQPPETAVRADDHLHSACAPCRRCLTACPTGALTTDGINPGLCRNTLNIERRGELSEIESAMLGNWIFGCDLCSACCPQGAPPPAAAVDLEWLLLSPAGELREAIAGTVMERAGVTLLRRNALYVLDNTRHPDRGNIMRRFITLTGSDLLRSIAQKTLHRLKK